MRISIGFIDRVGIAQEILLVFARRGLNVAAVEVAPPNIYLDIPGLAEDGLEEVARTLSSIEGVSTTRALDLLPGARRSLYFDALLMSLADPVLAIDREGSVQVANAAAETITGLDRERLTGAHLETLVSAPGLVTALAAHDYHLPPREVALGQATYLLESFPIRAPSGGVIGAVITLHSTHRIGERLSALQNADLGGFDSILGSSAALLETKRRATRMAAVDAPLLITGETGTGKELFAQACHAASSRGEQPFFALNCAAVPENLAESELFGYASGSFTGAQRGGKPGLLELADGGTVFLDEIGEMSPYLQAKLLRFLNDGSFRRVGGDREIRVDVRVISATHRALESMVVEGRFRQDLLFRLNVLQLEVPPLRARPSDILPLARHFITLACNQVGRPPAGLTPEAADALARNPWPGNIRQLQNVIFRAITMSDRRMLDVGDLELAVATDPARAGADQYDSLDDAVAACERTLLETLYPLYPSTRLLAQRLRTSHTAIANRLRKYGIGGR